MKPTPSHLLRSLRHGCTFALFAGRHSSRAERTQQRRRRQTNDNPLTTGGRKTCKLRQSWVSCWVPASQEIFLCTRQGLPSPLATLFLGCIQSVRFPISPRSSTSPIRGCRLVLVAI